MSGSSSEKVSLSLGDLQSVVNLIKMCSSRGAFQAKELESVGTLYNHLELFIKQTQSSLEDNSESNNSESNNSEERLNVEESSETPLNDHKSEN